jgi:hypothetical protein
VYWIDNGRNGTVNRVPKAGGANVVLAANRACPDGMAVDTSVSPSMVYWSDDTVAGASNCSGSYVNGVIARVSSQGGAAETLAQEQNNPVSVAVDATNVYWVASGAGAVRRLPKPTSQPTSKSACNPTVYILRDQSGNNGNVTNLTAALATVGITATDAGVDRIFSGTVPTNLTGYGAIYLLGGGRGGGEMPAATQTAVTTATNTAKVGLVLTGGASESRRLSRWASFATNVLFTSSGTATVASLPHNLVPGAGWRSEIWQGIPNSFTPGTSMGVANTSGSSVTNGGTLIATAGTSTVYGAVAVRDEDLAGRGRVVQFNYIGASNNGAANFSATNANSFTQATVNAIRWAAKCL